MSRLIRIAKAGDSFHVGQTGIVAHVKEISGKRVTLVLDLPDTVTAEHDAGRTREGAPGFANRPRIQPKAMAGSRS